MKKVILIGGIGKPNEFVGGELTKNKNLIESLENNGRTVIKIDTYKSRKYIWKLLRIPIILLIYPKTPVIVSTNIGNIYWLFKYWTITRTQRIVSFIGTGGVFSQWLVEGKFNQKYLRFLHVIMVQGKKMQEELNSVGLTNNALLLNSKKITYLPDLTCRNKQNNITRFVFLSRMRAEKGIDYILDCIDKLNLNGYQNNFSVTFYGNFEDNYKERFDIRLKTIANANYNGILNLRTNAGYDELSSYDIMLFPTFWKGEGFPGVVIDALIAGLPIIISDWNFNADYVEEGLTGHIIPSQNEEALCNAMQDAINNKQKYRNMSAYCQKTALKYDTRKVLNEELIQKLGV